MEKIPLYLRTIRHLHAKQIGYRLYYALRGRLRRLTGMRYPLSAEGRGVPLSFQPGISSPVSLAGSTFTFLNRAVNFPDGISWGYGELGKLWSYNLNYFDFLHQPELGKDEGLELIRDFISALHENAVGLEPYPTSLRIINWIKFLGTHGVSDPAIDASLKAQSDRLMNNLEYHLLGNHLLENSFALLFAACYFRDPRVYKKGRDILVPELEEQVLPDGAHFELSPMYHQTMLHRLLDSVNLLQENSLFNDELLPFLQGKAASMLGWLEQITFTNGDIPLVNDASMGIAPTTQELSAYAAQLGLRSRVSPLRESGYRKIAKGPYELLVDVGNIGPDYIPGHAHSDTFNFVLHLDGCPFIVDTGTSTYETCRRRKLERGTAAHNTVELCSLDQSEVWGSFRVARRAKVHDLEISGEMISAWHDGYLRLGARHRRTFRTEPFAVELQDEILSRRRLPAKAFLHFAPGVKVRVKEGRVLTEEASVSFEGAERLTLGEYRYAPEFNRLIPAKVVEIVFVGQLVTRIKMRK